MLAVGAHESGSGERRWRRFRCRCSDSLGYRFGYGLRRRCGGGLGYRFARNVHRGGGDALVERRFGRRVLRRLGCLRRCGVGRFLRNLRIGIEVGAGRDIVFALLLLLRLMLRLRLVFGEPLLQSRLRRLQEAGGELVQ
ncbi:MAG TPA: hypothetical protein PLG77_15510, partial [Burkholderiaceae bacterium]|nr:hypothetical protein [Burkholderiaceae bacterium]